MTKGVGRLGRNRHRLATCTLFLEKVKNKGSMFTICSWGKYTSYRLLW